MLVLSRKPAEKILIGNNIVITVCDVVGGRVRLGIEAPPDVLILRQELAGRPQSFTRRAASAGDPDEPQATQPAEL